ncbi:MAG: hypothetical protein MPW15_26495 [Candidatus Manganitrophus sp.]|nr:hypothetical protein [Candidatus Manganitrophus sp.]
MTDRLDEALEWVATACRIGQPLSIGLVGNAGEVYPELIRRGKIPDIVTDQTPAHDLLSYVPIGDVAELDRLRERDPKALSSKVARHNGSPCGGDLGNAVGRVDCRRLRQQPSRAGGRRRCAG